MRTSEIHVYERIYYEIAMSIGNSLDLGAMLREAVSIYLRRLNCLAGAVLQQETDEAGLVSFRSIYAIPKRMRPNSAVLEAIESVPKGLDSAGVDDYLASLPEQDKANGNRRYVMELPGFGVLLLIKSAPLEEAVLKSLAPLNVKFAGACISCLANERLQREIRERELAEEKYRSIFNNAVEGIFQTSMDGRLLHVNAAMARLLGYEKPEEVIERYDNIGEQVYANPEDRVRLINLLKRRGRASAFEVKLRRRDGAFRWGSFSARLVRGADGSPQYIEGMVDDVTAKHQAVDALREAKKEAERLSMLKSNFLSMVSHELRTPLTSILGFAKLARKALEEIMTDSKAATPEALRRLERIAGNNQVIVTEGERLTELINNVLDLAKLEAGRFEWDMEEVPLEEILRHSLAATEVLFDRAGLSLAFELPDQGLPMVQGDRDRLVQVVINLLSNAAKFTKEGTVTLSAFPEEGRVVVKVADTGIGVPEEERDVIFDKFRQLGNTLTDKPKGSGLGLPISKEIVEHHHGTLWHEPNAEGGSVFAFTLPVMD
ncbi:PAS domain S-box protein [Pseudodesulfovibrio cashew]|uniref:histidine kinase n=1 Tax=Pseudodesulfovibrio cashew TaxID=2678688 RepID=A0A6I6JCJ4_9BACT|nr:PAS domain-containing sensor histidine kinase [Pseudodesulfovibrio cashew]QGY38859.1 PAS domain S-box protein [Pseudodesulfovibrio cashew]